MGRRNHQRSHETQDALITCCFKQKSKICFIKCTECKHWYLLKYILLYYKLIFD